MQLKGQAAIVTGGGSGLGAATARALAKEGAKVAVLDINEDNAKKIAAEIGGVAVKCDVADAKSGEDITRSRRKGRRGCLSTARASASARASSAATVRIRSISSAASSTLISSAASI